MARATKPVFDEALSLLATNSNPDTVAFVQEWMMSGDHDPDQWHHDFAAAIDARFEEETLALSRDGERETFAQFQQRRGRLPDLIEGAISIYDGFMKDDDYDARRCLDRVIAKLESARDFYDATLPASIDVVGKVREEEREACAKVADDFATVADAAFLTWKGRAEAGSDGMDVAGGCAIGMAHQARRIANSIRSLKDNSNG